MANLVRWSDIVLFHTLRNSIKKVPELLGGNNIATYRGKVKLDGTNSAISLYFSDNQIVPQSREQVLDGNKDNFGFAAWTRTHADAWMKKLKHLKQLTYNFDSNECSFAEFNGFSVFGEWIGPGVINRTAVGKIGKKVFAIFAAQPVGSNHLIVEPDELDRMFGDLPDTYVLPWLGNLSDSKSSTSFADPITIDWSQDDAQLQNVVEKLNSMVLEVEKCDPWVKKVFGIEGMGEGIVFYPLSDHDNSGEKYKQTKTTFSNIGFKVKGSKHQTVETKQPVQVNAEVAASADAFAKMVLPQARLEQGVKLANGGNLEFDMKKIGNFLKWINTDVQKECQAELEASNLSWKDVEKSVGTRARSYYLDSAKGLVVDLL